MSPRNPGYIFFLTPISFTHAIPFVQFSFFQVLSVPHQLQSLPSWAGFVLSFSQPVSLDGPAQPLCIQHWSSLLVVASLAMRGGWNCSSPCPTSKPARTASVVGTGPGEGQDPQGVSSGYFWAVSPAEVAGGAPCCPQDAGGAVNRLQQLFFALLEYSLGSHWMHDFTMSLAFPGRLRLCCKF